MERRRSIKILTITKPARIVGLLIALAMITRPPQIILKDADGFTTSAGYPLWLWEAYRGMSIDYRMLVIQLVILFVAITAVGNRTKKD